MLISCHFLGKGKNKKNDTRKSKRNIISETTSTNSSVNVYLDDPHVSDNDNDLLNTSPITVPVTPPPFREKASEIYSRKLYIITFSFSKIILTLLSNIR